jgi:hypothetical protein
MKKSKVRYSYFNALVSKPLVLFSAACSVVFALPAHAQFDRLLQQLQKIAPPPGGAGGGAAPGFPGSSMPAPGGQRAGRNDQAQGLSICNVHRVATTSRPAAEVDRLLLSQFKVSGEQFFNEAFGALSRPRKSESIPNLQMFSGSMETRRGNALFSTFLAWPEPEVMAEIIAETQNRRDPQIASDAQAILILVHWAVPSLSKEPNAWLRLAQDMRPVTHVVSSCLWGRLHATGEGGVPVSQGDAVEFYRKCGDITSQYKSQDPVVKTLDDENYYSAGLLPETLKIIIERHPRALSRLGPFAASMKAEGDRMEGVQQVYRQQFVTTPPGRTAIAATQLVSRAEQVGAKVISNSQQMSRTYGDLQANAKQTESGQGNREGEFIPNPAIQARMAMMAAAAKNAEAPEVAALNEVRQLQGAAAVGLARAREAVRQELFAALFNGGPASGMKYISVYQELDSASVRSCRAYNSFTQAARARNVSTQEDDKSSTSMLSDMMSAK